MQDFFSVVGSFGFPVAVASYLLFRFEKKLEDLSKANSELCAEIRELKEVIIVDLKEEIVGLKKQLAKKKL
jgi:hypothetical protein